MATTMSFQPISNARATRRQLERQRLIPKDAIITDYNDAVTILNCVDLDLLKTLYKTAGVDLERLTLWANARNIKEATQKKRAEEWQVQADVVRMIADRIAQLETPAEPAPTPIEYRKVVDGKYAVAVHGVTIGTANEGASGFWYFISDTVVGDAALTMEEAVAPYVPDQPAPAPMPEPIPITRATRPAVTPQSTPTTAESYARSVGRTVTQKGRNLWVAFDAKPSQEIRDQLKAYGFRWAAKRQAWWLDTTRTNTTINDMAAG